MTCPDGQPCVPDYRRISGDLVLVSSVRTGQVKVCTIGAADVRSNAKHTLLPVLIDNPHLPLKAERVLYRCQVALTKSLGKCCCAEIQDLCNGFTGRTHCKTHIAELSIAMRSIDA